MTPAPFAFRMDPAGEGFVMLGSVVLFYLAGVNLAAFAAFGIDKRKAVRHRKPARRGFLWACR